MKITKNKGLICHAPKSQASVNLVCFPFGGAAASAYRTWGSQFPADVQLWSVQLPGRENRFSEPYYENTDAFVEKMIGDIREAPLKNLVFFGHSMGSILAYVVARRMTQLGLTTPKLLILSGHGAVVNPEGKVWSAAPESELLQHIKLLGGISPDFLSNPDFVDVYLQKLRADYKLYESTPALGDQPIASEALIIGGDRDPLLRTETQQQWLQMFHGAVEHVTLPGGHFYFLENPGPLIGHMVKAIRSHQME